MTMIPAILLSIMRRDVDYNLYMLCLDDKKLPWRLRAQVINQYRRQPWSEDNG